MQQQLQLLTWQFTPLVQAVQTNQSAIQNVSVTAQKTTIQIVKFTDGMDIDAYLTTFDFTCYCDYLRLRLILLTSVTNCEFNYDYMQLGLQLLVTMTTCD